jgi:hypothetical protein
VQRRRYGHARLLHGSFAVTPSFVVKGAAGVRPPPSHITNMMHGLSRAIAILNHEERGQDVFEYLLVVGAIVVAFAVGFLAYDTLVADFLGSACDSVNTAGPGSTECINP